MSLPTTSLECIFTSEEGEGSPASPSLREIFPARNERKSASCSLNNISSEETLAANHFPATREPAIVSNGTY